ncbi:cysteine-rich receptor-like protein kinase 2 isoform X2 [Coffea eugenioides]|uniref:cysteine-rich receptor-like protein kinase 2 isoform X2 n=1 Tax=Coffea eugenioides TaxID=49369 RepID=UPI000F60DEF4|nr:cysteine-rich receptor-like protein kinase 2 isoform X2 [Coffea eugenioides]
MMREFQIPTIASLLLILVATMVLPDASVGDPRAQTVEFMCGHQPEHNTTLFVPNFVATMENISDQMRSKGFGVSITGKGPDTNYGLAQCYGDLSLLDCVLCYAEARTVLPQCFPFNGGRIFLDGCFMRAENYSFFQEFKGPQDHAVCGNRTRKSSTFQEAARRAVLQAATGAPNSNGYARAALQVSGTSNESAYVLADCWKTLNANSCRACLENASKSILGCLPWSEGRALNTGCFMRYSDINFLNPIQGSGRSRGTVVVIVVAAVSSAIVLAVGAIIGAYFWKNKRIQQKRKGSNDAEKLVKTLHDSSLNFKYSTLEKATGSFDEANKLGQGGFGTVYKGVLPDGREIAVKRLFFNNKHRAADFYNEVNIISSVEHKNLVRLLGCSCSGPESLLVYEFLPNKSLDRFIFDANKGKALNWEKRFEIIIGTAEGLVYLHENTKCRIIHRDIKASNILLDSRLRSKIADFGLARSFQEDKSHISTAIAGTLGYMAPEYLAHGQLTDKADVYSFGVLLLEIVSGRQNNRSKTTEYSDSLVTIAWKHFLQGKVEELFDPNLMLQNYLNMNVRAEVLRVVHIGLLCTQEIPSLRPSMSTALPMLAKKDEQLPTPTNPPFIDESTMELNDTFENPHHPFRHGDSASNASLSHSSFYPR